MAVFCVGCSMVLCRLGGACHGLGRSVVTRQAITMWVGRKARLAEMMQGCENRISVFSKGK